MTMTIQELAKFVCNNMEYDEERKIYHQKKPGDPQWIQDMIYECHYNGMLPDDYVFEWVYEICNEISELSDDDDPTEIEVFADTYTHDLLKWLSSNLARLDFVEDAIDEGYEGKCDLALMIGIGQEKEKREVLWTIVEHLQNRLEDMADEEIELYHEVCKDEIT